MKLAVPLCPIMTAGALANPESHLDIHVKCERDNCQLWDSSLECCCIKSFSIRHSGIAELRKIGKLS